MEPIEPEPFSSMDDSQLLKYVYFLDMKNRQLTTRIAQLEPYKQREIKKPPANKQEALFSRFKMKRVALQIAYVGHKYNGFALQDNDVDSNTVEGFLFRCLYGLSLIRESIPSGYSRAGRTDKGVSAFGNVVAMDLRSAQEVNAVEQTNNNTRGKDQKDGELDYVKMLNSVLPEDIRILSAAKVSEDFNARHDCIQRTYKYLFPKGHLDIDAMRKALKYLVGTHDFSNFCKIDITETTTFTRTIYEASIQRVSDIDVLELESSDDRNEMYYFRFVGNSFLWHQIRFMASVMFIVGSGKEAPEVVLDLLDTKKTPKKPNYPAAPETPLILENCEYKGIRFMIHKEHAVAFYNTFNDCIMKLVLEMTLLKNCVDMARKWCTKIEDSTFMEMCKKDSEKRWHKVNHRLQLGRSTCAGVEQTASRLQGKKKLLYQKKKSKQLNYQNSKKELVQNQNQSRQSQEQVQSEDIHN